MRPQYPIIPALHGKFFCGRAQRFRLFHIARPQPKGQFSRCMVLAGRSKHRSAFTLLLDA